MERFMCPVCNGLYWRILTALSHCEGQKEPAAGLSPQTGPAQSSGIYGLGSADLHHDNSKLESTIIHIYFPKTKI